MIVERHAQGGVLTLTLNRPERGNALGPEMVEALLEAVESVRPSDTVHALVLRGAGRHFCTGLDLSDLDRCSDGDLLLRLVRIETLLARLWHAPLPTVAVAQGRAWGAGADLFAACERRVAMADATFRFPGAQFGIVLGTRRLAERVGVDAAREIVLGGGQWDAAQARSAGLVGEVVADTQAGGLGSEPWRLPVAAKPEPVVDAATAQAVRAASRIDARDADLAALVRSASVPGLHERMQAYRARQLAARAGAGAGA